MLRRLLDRWRWRRISARHKQWAAARERVRASDPEFFAAVSALLFKHDPVGINFDDNTDEYDAEAGTIIPRLPEATSVEALSRIVREEFERWFDGVAISSERFDRVAADLWQLSRSNRRA